MLYVCVCAYVCIYSYLREKNFALFSCFRAIEIVHSTGITGLRTVQAMAGVFYWGEGL